MGKKGETAELFPLLFEGVGIADDPAYQAVVIRVRVIAEASSRRS